MGDRTLVFEAIPGEQGHFDGDKSESQGGQIPTPHVVHEEAVFEEANGQAGGEDSGCARGVAAMLNESLVYKFAQDWDSAQDGMGHFSFSNWKMWSVGQAKMRAKVSASSRLGT